MLALLNAQLIQLGRGLFHGGDMLKYASAQFLDII
jgi:hypothetical protein